MAFTSLAVTLSLLVTSVVAGPLPQSTELTTSIVSPPTTTSPSTTPSYPGFPGLVNQLMLRPLVDFNNRLSEAASSVPEQFKNSGQTLGAAMIVPIQFGANVSNTFLTNLNSSIVSASNAVHPVIISPLAWMVNTTMGNMTLNAFNYSISQLGTGVNSMGGSISNAGNGLQNKGNTIIDWVNAMDQAMRKLNSTMITPTTTPVTPLLFSTNAPLAEQAEVTTADVLTTVDLLDFTSDPNFAA